MPILKATTIPTFGGKPLLWTPQTAWQNQFSCWFDGVNDQVRPAAQAWTYTERTWAFWFKTTTASKYAVYDSHLYVPRGMGVLVNAAQIMVRVATTSGVKDYYSDSGGAYTDGAWHHVVASVKNGGNVKVCVDGTIKLQTAFAWTLVAMSGTDWIQMGGTAGLQFVGWLDECCAWSRQLTDGGGVAGTTATGEVAELYNGGVPYDISTHSQFATCWGWWRFDGGIKNWPTIPDYSGNARHGTATNMASWSLQQDVP